MTPTIPARALVRDCVQESRTVDATRAPSPERILMSPHALPPCRRQHLPDRGAAMPVAGTVFLQRLPAHADPMTAVRLLEVPFALVLSPAEPLAHARRTIRR